MKYFKSLGHIPVGVEGSETFVEIARQSTGCDVYHMDFINLDLPQMEYDGIFATAVKFAPTSVESRTFFSFRKKINWTSSAEILCE